MAPQGVGALEITAAEGNAIPVASTRGWRGIYRVDTKALTAGG